MVLATPTFFLLLKAKKGGVNMEYGVGYSRLWFASGPIGRLGGRAVNFVPAGSTPRLLNMLDLDIIVLLVPRYFGRDLGWW